MSKKTQEAIEEMRKQLKLCEESLENLRREGEGESEDDTWESEDGRPIDFDDMMVIEKKENDGRKAVNTTEKPTIPQKEEGEDPPASKALDSELHPLLARRWKHFKANGIPKEEKVKLLEKYARREGFEAPKLNGEILAVLSESQKKRDEFLAETQRLTGSALMALGAAMSLLLNEKESIDKLSLLEKINDAAKLFCEVHFRQNEFRRAMIMSKVTERMKKLLLLMKSDAFLFGEDLSEKIETCKILQDLMRRKNSYRQNGRNRSQGHSGNLNFRGPQGRRVLPNQAGNSQSNNQGRPRLAFRPRQPFKPRR